MPGDRRREGGLVKRNAALKVLSLALSLAIASSCVHFHPRPIAPAKTMEDFEDRRLDAP